MPKFLRRVRGSVLQLREGRADELFAAAVCGWESRERDKPDPACRDLLNRQHSYSIKSRGINLPFRKQEQSVVKSNEPEIAVVKKWGSPCLITNVPADIGWSWSAFH